MKALKTVRNKLGYTPYKMAKTLGISQTSYTYLEQKAQGMKFKMLVKIRDASGMSWTQFGKLLDKEFS